MLPGDQPIIQARRALLHFHIEDVGYPVRIARYPGRRQGVHNGGRSLGVVQRLFKEGPLKPLVERVEEAKLLLGGLERADPIALGQRHRLQLRVDAVDLRVARRLERDEGKGQRDRGPGGTAAHGRAGRRLCRRQGHRDGRTALRIPLAAAAGLSRNTKKGTGNARRSPSRPQRSPQYFRRRSVSMVRAKATICSGVRSPPWMPTETRPTFICKMPEPAS